MTALCPKPNSLVPLPKAGIEGAVDCPKSELDFTAKTYRM